jgi:hypothetical protein
MTASLLLLAVLAVDTAPAAAQARGRGAPRPGTPRIGMAAPRVGPPPPAARPVYRGYGYPYRPGVGYPHGPGVSFGVHFGFGYGYPYGFSGYPYGYIGYGAGYGYRYPYYAAWPYAYPYGYGYPGYGTAYWGTSGGVRIQGAPARAEVLVDGYYAGIVDDFDGAFQQLRLEDGVHRIEIRTPTGPPLTFDVNVIPGQTITYRAQP